jgi:major membrane immunogen (membrane-anchored lipoprotein)
MIKKILSGLILSSVFLLVGCGKDTTTPIDGTWSASGENDGYAWKISYSFESGHYVIDGYPPIHDEGTFSLIESETNTYEVTLTPDEEPDSVYTVNATLAEDGEALTIGNNELKRQN